MPPDCNRPPPCNRKAGISALPDEEGIFVLPAALDAETALGRPGHLDITAALYRRDKVEGAVACQQRQGEQQSADELAGHVARQLVFAAFQSSFDGQARRRLFKAERLFLIQLSYTV